MSGMWHRSGYEHLPRLRVALEAQDRGVLEQVA